MEALVYGAEKVTTTKHRQFQVHRNRAWQAAAIWSNADRQKAIEQMVHEIYQVAPLKHNLFNKLLKHQKRQQLQKVRNKATAPWSIWAKQFCTKRNCSWREALKGGKHHRRQANAVSELPIRCSEGNNKLKLSWYGGRHYPAAERDLWHHLEWTEEVQEGTLHPLDRVWNLVGDIWHWDPLENYWTTSNTFQISK